MCTVRFEDLMVQTVKNTTFSLTEIYKCFSTTYRSVFREIH